ncbi:MAG TPA: pyridoxamine 5'-phosphate oxidase [Gemmatimonadales bacterium]|nr:pyridoxamine 5'-phosphate oxidase [Gemmatimonadales bacterium]
MSIADLRKAYALAELDERKVDRQPLRQFLAWLDEAVHADLPEPNAMTLATTTADGHPSARMVLLKGADDHGFVFFTDARSRKGEELTANPRAALVFWWAELERQVRIVGRTEPIAEAHSDAYFRSRPEGSRLSAWASHQSEVVGNRAELEARWAEAARRHADGDIARPAWWGGVRVIPEEYEFWQGRPNRLHDRIRYRRAPDGAWRLDRLSP